MNDHIDEYVSSIGSKLASDCTPGIRPVIRVVRNAEFENFSRAPFPAKEVYNVRNNININKSALITNVKTMFLKHASIDKVLKILNGSFRLSIFPPSWSTVVPLPRVPQPRTAPHLRPVALTPLPGKFKLL